MKETIYRENLRSLLGREVKVYVDRPFGSVHPKYPNVFYPLNYGFIKDLVAPDGEFQDAYVLGEKEPLSEFFGEVIAIIERSDDIEDKLVVAKIGEKFSVNEIESAVHFQEKFFRHRIIY